MSPRILAILAAIVLVIVVGMVMVMKRSVQTGAAARDPEAVQKPSPPAKR